jgi:hypothetical protein
MVFVRNTTVWCNWFFQFCTSLGLSKWQIWTHVPIGNAKVSVKSLCQKPSKWWQMSDWYAVCCWNARFHGTQQPNKLSCFNKCFFQIITCLKGIFVHHRKERRNRIQEMRANGLSNSPAASSVSSSAATISTPCASLTNEQNLPSWTIDETYVNKDAYSCVICVDTYVKDARVRDLSRCSHDCHSKCIQA